MIQAGNISANMYLNSSGFVNGLKMAEKELGKFEKKATKTPDVIDKAFKQTEKIGGTLTKYVSLPLLGIGTAAIKTSADFEAKMSKVQAISGATGDAMLELEAIAREMGATTRFSASDAADALTYMGMAGWDTDQMIAALPGVMNLAAASGEDLAMVSDIVTDSLSGFGLTAEDTNDFVDLLANTATNSNTNVAMMGETFKYVAPLAGALGYSAEDVALTTGLMANAGIKASQAGTTLRGALSRMVKPSEAAAIWMDKLDISLTDASGNMKPLNELIQDLRTSFGGLSEEQQAQAAAAIFGQNSMSGMLAIINATDEDLEKLTDATTNYTGAAEKMSDVMEDNLAGDLESLKSAFSELLIVAGKELIPVARDVVEYLTKILTKFNELDGDTKKTIINMGKMALATGPLVKGFGKTGGVVKSVMGYFLDSSEQALKKNKFLVPSFRDVGKAVVNSMLGTADSSKKLTNNLGEAGLGVEGLFTSMVLGGKKSVRTIHNTGDAASMMMEKTTRAVGSSGDVVSSIGLLAQGALGEISNTGDLTTRTIETVLGTSTQIPKAIQGVGDTSRLVMHEAIDSTARAGSAVETFVETSRRSGGLLENTAAFVGTALKGALTNPWTLGIGAAAVGLGVYASKFESFTDFTEHAMGTLENVFYSVGDLASEFFSGTAGQSRAFKQGLSETTQEGAKELLDLQVQASTALDELAFGYKKITDETVEEVVDKYEELKNKVVEHVETSKDETQKVLEDMFKNNVSLTREERDQIIAAKEEMHTKTIEKAEHAQSRINAILEEAKNNGVGLTDEMKVQINKIEKEMLDTGLDYLAKNAEEAEIMRKEMALRADDITAEQASAVAQNAIKQYNETTNQARKEFDERLRYAQMLRQQGGAENEELANKVEHEATRQYDIATKKAEELKDGVLKQASELAAKHGHILDESNGEILSGWQKLKSKIEANPIVRTIKTVGSGVASVASSAYKTVFAPDPVVSPKPQARYQRLTTYPRNAMGTSNWRGGYTWVGEHGPELVNLPKSTKIHTAATSKRLAEKMKPEPTILQATLPIVIDGKIVAETVSEHQFTDQRRKDRGRGLVY